MKQCLPRSATGSAIRAAREGELLRIARVYEQRVCAETAGRYALTNPAALFEHQQRLWRLVSTMQAEDLLPLADRRVLDVGCGNGQWLVEMESLGARREHLAGIELSPRRVERACQRLASGSSERRGADLRCGDASALPWGDCSFDIVMQNTVFSSILSRGVREDIAWEMDRVLRPNGAVLWYDLRADNPFNRDVRGVRRQEIARLFPGYALRLARVTLAPPLARAIVRVSRLAAFAAERLTIFNSHYLGVLRKPA
jgi:ubiquinone/menaquinone biosynthesis C-methylase UbiE